jgi:DNA helicase-2/ATP-dependent DNA helicase PcrA
MLDLEKVDVVKQRIRLKHQDDVKQLDVIFSAANRILVEAPAGYGKTATMVSKIAYMIAVGQIPNPKRLLALTFSVNAAYKIKKDVAQQVPKLLAGLGTTIDLSDKIFVSNYHGFSRNILKKYGYLIHSNLSSIDTMHSIDDTNIQSTQELITGLLLADAESLARFGDALKATNTTYINEHFDSYCSLVIAELLPGKIISYNGIIALAIKLLRDNPTILAFYHRYFTAMLVDEYQDTNALSFQLVELLINANTRIILLGDSLQRIYGFICAVPNLLSISEARFSLVKITLDKNYRFASNEQMLRLDANIRRNAERPRNPAITTPAEVDFTLYDNQGDESAGVVDKTLALTNGEQAGKVAILIKSRGGNINAVIAEFGRRNIEFFYGLFTDEDAGYLAFHRKCLFEFIQLLRVKNHITKKMASDHLAKIKDEISETPGPVNDALVGLLDIFWKKIFSDYSFLNHDEKVLLIMDTFEHNGLKQYVEFVTSNIIISTVHGAKGLEWDHVIIPDMEQDSFPGFNSLCGNCSYRRGCQLQITDQNETKFLEDLSVFYVAVTRARKQVYFTASKMNLALKGRENRKNVSCLLSLPGIQIDE